MSDPEDVLAARSRTFECPPAARWIPRSTSIRTETRSPLNVTTLLGRRQSRQQRPPRVLEPGTSAQTIEKRAVFREMLRFIKDHPGEIDYVIIYMRSRAFRNYIDAASPNGS